MTDRALKVEGLCGFRLLGMSRTPSAMPCCLAVALLGQKEVDASERWVAPGFIRFVSWRAKAFELVGACVHIYICGYLYLHK